jgi:hypothetical protein
VDPYGGPFLDLTNSRITSEQHTVITRFSWAVLSLNATPVHNLWMFWEFTSVVIIVMVVQMKPALS